jgi:ABC-type nitrate/sulfonate/bicarbonate transport system substrate-binding protein
LDTFRTNVVGICYSARMANNAKPIEKLKFRSPTARTRRAAATAAPGRAPALRGNAVPATGHAPVAIGRSPIPTATGIAQRLGWLEHEASLDATTLAVVGDPLAAPLRDPLRAAAPPSLLREGESVGALWERAGGGETRLVGLTWVDTFQGVLSLQGSGISEPAHLAGRRLGLPRDDAAPVDAHRAAARRGFHAALALAGSFPDEVVELDLPVSERAGAPYAAELAALQRGEVDAVFVAGAAGMAAASRIGSLLVVDLGSHLDPMVRAGATTPAAITVDARLLEERPNLVVRFLAVLLRAGAWAQAHPIRAAYLVAGETGTTREDVLAAHGEGWHERLHIDLSDNKLAALRAQRDFLRTYGFLDADVDFGAWIDPRPLAAARDLLAAERTAWV